MENRNEDAYGRRSSEASSKSEDDGMYSINYLEALIMKAIATRNENSILKSRISALENQMAQILNQR